MPTWLWTVCQNRQLQLAERDHFTHKYKCLFGLSIQRIVSALPMHSQSSVHSSQMLQAIFEKNQTQFVHTLCVFFQNLGEQKVDSIIVQKVLVESLIRFVESISVVSKENWIAQNILMGGNFG